MTPASQKLAVQLLQEEHGYSQQRGTPGTAPGAGMLESGMLESGMLESGMVRQPQRSQTDHRKEAHLSASDEGRKLIKSARQELRSINHLEIEEIIGKLTNCAVLRSHCDLNVEAAEQGLYLGTKR